MLAPEHMSRLEWWLVSFLILVTIVAAIVTVGEWLGLIASWATLLPNLS